MNTRPKSPASILIADDDDDIRLALEMLLVSNGYTVLHAKSPSEVHLILRNSTPSLVLLDMNFSKDTTSGNEGLQLLSELKNSVFPILLMTAWGNVELAVKGLTLGAKDFIEKPWNNDKLLNSVAHHLHHNRLNQQNMGYRKLLSQSSPTNNAADDWVCASPAMQAIETLVTQVAATDANILILGENGTGKSQLAQRIHRLSHRKEQPFVSINMAAIPSNLFESELFGHQKGAFTDAKKDRLGRFELADKGSLFFDEIGALPMELQAKLLRVLETGEYEALGSSITKTANVRVISATNADLNSMTAERIFRQDLLYRLNTIIITMPPLRQRLADLPALCSLFVQQLCRRYQKPIYTINQQALDKLSQYHWPGNIRELSHVLERAVLMSTRAELSAQSLVLASTNNAQTNITIQPLEQAEKQLIEKTLQLYQGSVAQAANVLAISRNALYRRMEKYNIDSSQYQ